MTHITENLQVGNRSVTRGSRDVHFLTSHEMLYVFS